MTEQPQPPRLQDTTERSALPLPLPDHGSPGEGPVYAARGEQPAFASPQSPPTIGFAAASAGDDEREGSTEETEALPSVDPDAPAPIPDEEPAAEPPSGDEAAGAGDGQPDLDPVFAPPAAESFGAAESAEEGGPAPEVLVGAAFLGGVALAFLIKRLGS